MTERMRDEATKLRPRFGNWSVAAESRTYCGFVRRAEKRRAYSPRGREDTSETFVSAKCELGVGVDYPKPESIGADRLANAAAVVALYGSPAVVVDFGTAVTFDVVSAERCYIGGVIAPGLEAMTNYLYKRTALLPS